MEIKYSRQSFKFLKSLDKALKNRIVKKIKTLKNHPVPHDAKSVKGFQEKLFRIRVGDYRVLYEIEGEVIGIVKIDKRERAY